MRALKLTVGPLVAASANNIALSQTTSGAAALILNGTLASGGVATLDTPRNILITDGGNDSTIKFIVAGTTFGNSPVTETVTGTNGGTVATLTDFATVTSIKTTGATSGSGVTVGTTTTAGSNWLCMDEWALSPLACQVEVTGTINYTMQLTSDDPNGYNSTLTIPGVTWDSSMPGLLVSQTTSAFTVFTGIPKFVRILLNSGTGSLLGRVTQAGSVMY